MWNQSAPLSILFFLSSRMVSLKCLSDIWFGRCVTFRWICRKSQRNLRSVFSLDCTQMTVASEPNVRKTQVMSKNRRLGQGSQTSSRVKCLPYPPLQTERDNSRLGKSWSYLFCCSIKTFSSFTAFEKSSNAMIHVTNNLSDEIEYDRDGLGTAVCFRIGTEQSYCGWAYLGKLKAPILLQNQTLTGLLKITNTFNKYQFTVQIKNKTKRKIKQIHNFLLCFTAISQSKKNDANKLDAAKTLCSTYPNELFGWVIGNS